MSTDTTQESMATFAKDDDVDPFADVQDNEDDDPFAGLDAAEEAGAMKGFGQPSLTMSPQTSGEPRHGRKASTSNAPVMLSGAALSKLSSLGPNGVGVELRAKNGTSSPEAHPAAPGTDTAKAETDTEASAPAPENVPTVEEPNAAAAENTADADAPGEEAPAGEPEAPEQAAEADEPKTDANTPVVDHKTSEPSNAPSMNGSVPDEIPPFEASASQAPSSHLPPRHNGVVVDAPTSVAAGVGLLNFAPASAPSTPMPDADNDTVSEVNSTISKDSRMSPHTMLTLSPMPKPDSRDTPNRDTNNRLSLGSTINSQVRRGSSVSDAGGLSARGDNDTESEMTSLTPIAVSEVGGTSDDEDEEDRRMLKAAQKQAREASQQVEELKEKMAKMASEIDQLKSQAERRDATHAEEKEHLTAQLEQERSRAAAAAASAGSSNAEKLRADSMAEEQKKLAEQNNALKATKQELDDKIAQLEADVLYHKKRYDLNMERAAKDKSDALAELKTRFTAVSAKQRAVFERLKEQLASTQAENARLKQLGQTDRDKARAYIANIKAKLLDTDKKLKESMKQRLELETTFSAQRAKLQEEVDTDKAEVTQRGEELERIRQELEEKNREDELQKSMTVTIKGSDPVVNGDVLRAIVRNQGKSALIFQWRRSFYGSNFMDIAGANEADYTPTADDIGAVLRADVTLEDNPLVNRHADIGPIGLRKEILEKLLLAIDHKNHTEHMVTPFPVPAPVKGVQAKRQIVLEKGKIKIKDEHNKTITKEPYSKELECSLVPGDPKKFRLRLNKSVILTYQLTASARDYVVLCIRCVNYHGMPLDKEVPVLAGIREMNIAAAGPDALKAAPVPRRSRNPTGLLGVPGHGRSLSFSQNSTDGKMDFSLGDSPSVSSRGVRKKECVQCGKEELPNRKLNRCKNCKHVYYCDRECQKDHWPVHSLECAKLAKLPHEPSVDNLSTAAASSAAASSAAASSTVAEKNKKADEDDRDRRGFDNDPFGDGQKSSWTDSDDEEQESKFKKVVIKSETESKQIDTSQLDNFKGLFGASPAATPSQRKGKKGKKKKRDSKDPLAPPSPVTPRVVSAVSAPQSGSGLQVSLPVEEKPDVKVDSNRGLKVNPEPLVKAQPAQDTPTKSEPPVVQEAPVNPMPVPKAAAPVVVAPKPKPANDFFGGLPELAPQEIGDDPLGDLLGLGKAELAPLPALGSPVPAVDTTAKTPVQAFVIETVNARQNGGELTAFSVAGQVDLVLATPAKTESVVYFHFDKTDRVKGFNANPAVASSLGNGAYACKVPAGQKSVIALKYTVKLTKQECSDWLPLRAHSRWELTDSTVGVNLQYTVSEKLSSPLLKPQFLLTIEPAGAVSKCLLAQPECKWHAKMQKLLWAFPSLPAKEAGAAKTGTFNAKLAVTQTCTHKPVDIKFELDQLGDGQIPSGILLRPDNAPTDVAQPLLSLSSVTYKIKTGVYQLVDGSS